MKSIILVYGYSASGKTSIINKVCQKYNLKELQSYTTRGKRYFNEKGHEFVKRKEFEEIVPELVAYSFFNGEHYGATQKQCNESDFFVIDPTGIEIFKEKYKGDKNFIIVEVKVNPIVRYFRIIKRSGLIKGTKRFMHDFIKFKISDITPNHTINNKVLADSVELLYEIYSTYNDEVCISEE